MKKKIYIIRFKGTRWKSANAITRSWAKIYKSWVSPDLEVITKIITKNNTQKTMSEIIRESWLEESEIHITVIDNIILYSLISFWGSYMNPKNTKFHFHFFTDVLERRRELQEVSKGLKGFSVNFVVASGFVATAVRKYLPSKNIHVIPFPMPNIFFENKIERRSGTKIIAYVGRLSVDKGVLDLIEWWIKNPSLRDIFELHLVGEKENRHEFSDINRSVWKKLNKKLLGYLADPPEGIKVRKISSKNKMAYFLAKVSVVISFSTFPLEGYGLAIGEAIASGCGCLITRWRGHKSFEKTPYVRFIDVNLKKDKVITPTSLPKKLLKLSDMKIKQARHQREWAQKNISTDIVSKKLFSSLNMTNILK